MLLPVVMAGGNGSRLWPMSRSGYPKQFLVLDGQQSMLQTTLQRVAGLTGLAATVICNEEHRFLVAEQVREANLALGALVLEPEGRNTAPAIALAAIHALQQGQDPLLLVLAADHVIRDEAAFHQAVRQAQPLAEQGRFVVFGIVPQSAETGYGYIKAVDDKGLSPVARFVEKPDAKTAEAYVAAGNYYWNSGMFLFRASRYLQELARFQPEMVAACEAAMAGAVADMDFIRVNAEAFMACPENSIDYAVMEPMAKLDDSTAENSPASAPVWVVPLDAGWNDIGSWSALWDIGSQDSEGNVLHGDVIAVKTMQSYVRADNKLVATVGIDNVIVIDTKDAMLVASRDAVQDVKQVVAMLKAQGRGEHSLHREVYRPWGKYDSVDNGVRYQVKRITVKPGEKLSKQMHHHRAEHWIVVSGTALVHRNEEVTLLSENESVYIPIGVIHSLENPGKIPLELIEVQSGSYLGEDDIVRFEDRYGRV